MFKTIIKHIITVLVVSGCVFLCLIAGLAYWYSMGDLDFQLRKMVAMGEVTEAVAVPIGKTYLENTSAEGTYYEVFVTFKNTGNYPVDYVTVDWNFRQSGPGYTDRSVKIYNRGNYYEEALLCVPAGKEGVLKRVIELNDDAESAKMIFINEYTKEQQVIDLQIKER